MAWLEANLTAAQFLFSDTDADAKHQGRDHVLSAGYPLNKSNIYADIAWYILEKDKDPIVRQQYGHSATTFNKPVDNHITSWVDFSN